MTRIAVTGIGALAPVGLSLSECFQNLIEGHSGIGPASLSLDETFGSRITGEVKNLVVPTTMATIKAKRLGRFTQLSLMAAHQALEDADLAAADYRKERIACVLGVGIGGLEALEEAAEVRLTRGVRRVSPLGIPMMIPNMAAGMVATLADARGPSLVICTACASGAHAIGHGVQLLRAGAVDAVICGGAEACVTPLTLASFAAMGALSRRNDDPTGASRPFEKHRDGFVLAEGATIMILERESDAKKRSAQIHGYVAGFGATTDAYHPTQPIPDGRGAIAAMNGALDDACLSPDKIDYVNAHGTGTHQNDSVEAKAIRAVFGNHTDEVMVSSTKGATGHMLGAGGAFEAFVCLQALRRGIVPPTLNLEEPDPECALNHVPNVARETRVRAALSNSFGFGGQNASLVLTSA